MAKTMTIDMSINMGGQTTSGQVTKTGEAEIDTDVDLLADAADKEVTLAFLTTDLTLGGLVFLCDQAITIDTNSTSVPDDTFNVPAGGQCEVTALAAHITKIYVTKDDDDATATLKIRGVKDATP